MAVESHSKRWKLAEFVGSVFPSFARARSGAELQSHFATRIESLELRLDIYVVIHLELNAVTRQ